MSERSRDANRILAHAFATGARQAASEKAIKTKAKKRQFRELLKYMMEADLPVEDDIRAELEDVGFEQTDYQTAMLFGQLKKAVYGSDTDAAKFVRDTAGYKPTDAVQVGNLDEGLRVNLAGLSDEQLMQMISEKT